MQVILLEKIRNLGTMGDKVKVKAGYSRNFLIPKGKAVSARLKLILLNLRRVVLNWKKRRLNRQQKRSHAQQNLPSIR